ncbi:MAG TPA: PRC-barrel domain-containing protein [Candidatus Paceibacterota bacterium]|nr:PRC-barrel domain-containing protein [Candidatus Paceibacterota bacterium]
MKRTFFTLGFICALSAALSTSAFAQGSSSVSGGTGGGASSSDSDSLGTGATLGSSGISGPAVGASSSNSWSSGQLSATGRGSDSSQQAVRGSKLLGAEVSDSSGNRIGRIEDVIVNLTSGKLDFAIISRSNQGGANSPLGSNSGYKSGSSIAQESPRSGSSQGGSYGSETTSSSGGAGSSGKLVPVPWSLLQPASGSSSAGSTMNRQQSFTLTVDSSKLAAAPSLNRGSWSEIGQSGWSQRVNSYYGVSETGGSSTGASESPSGSGSSGAGSGGASESTGQPDGSGQTPGSVKP